MTPIVGLSIGELWSPQTDAGVLVQVIVTIALIVGLSWLVRRERALVQLIVGVGMIVLAWYGIRAIH